MAYVPNSLDAESDDKKRLNVSGTSAGPATGGGQGTSVSPGVSNAPSAPSGSSGGFTNIGDYLQANAGGAEKLGQNVADNLNKETNEAKTALDTGVSNLQNKVNENTVNYDRSAVQNAIDTGNISDSVTKQLSGDYKGPTSLSDIGAREGIDNALNDANQKSQLSATQGGRVELLRQIAGRPQTGGVTRLNSALLQGNEAARNNIAEAAKGITNVNTGLTSAEDNAKQWAAQAAATNAATKEQTLGAINSDLDTEQKTINARLANLTSQQQNAQDLGKTWLSKVGGHEGFTNDYKQLGLTQEQAANLVNATIANRNDQGNAVDLNQFYTPTEIASLNQSNVVDPQNAARLSALAALAGRAGFQSSNPNLRNTFDYNAAINALNSNRAAAVQARNEEAARVAAQQARDNEAARIAAEQAAAAAAAQQAQQPQAPQTLNDQLGVPNLPGPNLPALPGLPSLPKPGKCVVASALVQKGNWKESDRGSLIDWCKDTLHDTVIGEALRRGYQVIGSKVIVPGIHSGGIKAKYLQWQFEQATNLLRNKKVKLKSIPGSILWMAAMLVTGAVVSKKFASKCWKSLYE